MGRIERMFLNINDGMGKIYEKIETLCQKIKKIKDEHRKLKAKMKKQD